MAQPSNTMSFSKLLELPERIWIQLGAPDLEVVKIETDDLNKMLKEYATSSHP